jgi:hypothetical protein
MELRREPHQCRFESVDHPGRMVTPLVVSEDELAGEAERCAIRAHQPFMEPSQLYKCLSCTRSVYITANQEVVWLTGPP